jgi:hypothetical protein
MVRFLSWKEASLMHDSRFAISSKRQYARVNSRRELQWSLVDARFLARIFTLSAPNSRKT